MLRRSESSLLRRFVGVAASLSIVIACRTENLVHEWEAGHPAAAASATAPNPRLPNYLEQRTPIEPIRQTSGEAVHPEPPMTAPGNPAPRSVPPKNMDDMEGHSHHEM